MSAARILTSNQSFGSWATVFGDRIIATAILDRVLHHAITINIRSNSYRRSRGVGEFSMTAPGGNWVTVDTPRVPADDLRPAGMAEAVIGHPVVPHGLILDPLAAPGAPGHVIYCGGPV
jgi:hypothetical protein